MAILTGTVLFDVIGLITALVTIFIAYYKWSFQYWKNRNVPCLEPKIPSGDIPGNKYIGDEFADLYNKAKLRGLKYCGIYMLASPTLLVIDLDILKLIMTKDFNQFVNRGNYFNERDDPISAHLFSIGGVKWRNLRTKLTPTFTSGKMRSMFQTLLDCGKILEHHIKSLDSNEAVDIKDILGCFSTDIIGSCAFGLNCNSFKEPDSPFRRYSKKVFERNRLQSMRNIIVQSFQPLGRFLRMRVFPKDVSEFFTKTVEDVVTYRKKNSVTRKDFLHLLIDLKDEGEEERGSTGDGKSLTMTEMVAQSFVFFVAGYETTSTTLTFALFELATNLDIQDKLRKEIVEVLRKHNNEITYDSLSEMKYMGQVIDETLRKYPPLSFLTRECVEDYTVPGENVVIEKGTRILIPVKGIHYDEEYYNNPTVFDPERFSEENKGKRHHYTHLPFGEGPRICIGARFGIMETKIGLTSILRNFKVTLNERTKTPLTMYPNNFISTADGGIWLNFENY